LLNIDPMTERRLKVLLVEDEDAYAELVGCSLAGCATTNFDLRRARRLGDALPRLQAEPFDVILLDLSLPDRLGLRTYTDMRTAAPAVPVIVLTGVDDEQLALQAVRAGAQDYLVKGQLDARMLPRLVRHAIERKRAGETLRQREEFFRLISENVHDLIAVLDQEGRRLYNSPSYRPLLGDPAKLVGTDSFDEVHPDDRARVKRTFRETLKTGVGQRAEYRLVARDGSVRFIESQGSVIRGEDGQPCKVVVVSRDITERKEAVETLRSALADLKRSHEELKAAQMQLVQAEKLEAVSTFAAGVAHEVKNPLQAIILGVDYLSQHLAPHDEAATSVLADMDQAVTRADGIIRGLLEFAAHRQREARDEDLNAIIEHALPAVEHELVNGRITLVKDLAPALPRCGSTPAR
jgi:PAS domain S-box-containing protein